MEKISYFKLAESKNDFERLISKFGLKMEPDTWLSRAFIIIERLSRFYDHRLFMIDPAGYRQFIDKEDQVLFALHDVCLIENFSSLLQHEEGAFLKRKLQNILKLSPLNLETETNVEARNTLWEFNFLARLKNSGINADLADPNPDIIASFSKRKYFIQCKRCFSNSPRSLRRNIKDAVNQLEKDLQNNSTAFGIIALSLEFPITNGQLMLKASTEEHGKNELRRLLENIRIEHGQFWQDPSVIKDQRIIGIVLHVSVPCMIKDSNIFSIGSQTHFNNTWINTGDFRYITEDFASLAEY